MPLFCKVCFWMFLVSFVLKLLCLGIVDYPRTAQRWQDMLDLITIAPFIVWAWYLVWGV